MTSTIETKPALQPTSPGEDEQRLLRDRMIDFDEVEIDFAEIDVETSKHNQARFLPLHDEIVLTYAAAMEAGDVFPPIVLTGAKGKYVVLDGNHRVAAAGLAGYKRTKVFLCKGITKAQAELLTFEANARHGLPTTVEERVQQALYLVNIGNQPKAVARALAVPDNKLYRAMAISRGTTRVQKMGLDPTKIHEAVLARLSAIPANTLLRPIAELAIRASLNSDEVSEIVVALNAEKGGETEQMKIVDRFVTRYRGRTRSTSGGRMKNPVDVNRITIIARYCRHIDAATLGKIVSKIDPSDAATVRRDIFESIASLVGASEAVKGK